MSEGKKLEPKLSLDMDFNEALARFAQADPKEVAETVHRSKTKKPPGEASPRRPGRTSRQTSTSIWHRLRS